MTVPEPEPLGRGGGIRLAAGARQEEGDIYALNGDELLDVDLAALLARHRELEAAATIVVTHPRSPFGVVELDGDLVTGFEEAGVCRTGSAAASTSWGEEAIAGLPERGDHETTTFPALAARGGSPRSATKGSG